MRLLKQSLRGPISVLLKRVGKCWIRSRQSGIALLAVAGLVLTPAFSYGEASQVFSVEESRPGRVIVTLGVLTPGPLDPLDFWLEFDGKDAVQAKKVEPVPSVRPTPAIILLVDQGSAIPAGAVEQVREALKEFASGPPFPGSIALWAFNSQVKKIHGFSDLSVLATGMDQIGVMARRGDKTKLYEAMGLALAELRGHPATGPKRLVVITAGRDDGSSISEQTVTSGANADGISIDTIALGDVSDEGSSLLARLAKDTKGHYIPPGTSELAHSLHEFLAPAPSDGVQVFFDYEPMSQGHKAKAVRLEFVRDGKHILLPVRSELVLPKERALGGGLPYGPAIGQKNATELMLVWISTGLAGFAAAYLASRILRKRREKDGSEEEHPDSNWEP